MSSRNPPSLRSPSYPLPLLRRTRPWVTLHPAKVYYLRANMIAGVTIMWVDTIRAPKGYLVAKRKYRDSYLIVS